MTRGQHQWDYVGHDTETGDEYAFCELCGKYKIHNTGEIISKKRYNERYENGKIKI
jgi:hypothetical protein